MQLLEALNEPEGRTKFTVKGSGVIAHDFEPAAFRRTFGAKRADDDVAAWLDSADTLPNVGKTLLWCGKKMEYRSIMPEIVGMWFQFNFEDIADQPPHLLRNRPQPLLCDFDCGLRDIEYGEVLVSAEKQIVN